MIARLGLGTYRVREVAAAASRAAATSSTAWVDTAPNYARARAQTLLAPVLALHPHLKVATKIGFLTERTAADAIREGVLTLEQADAGHSLDRGFVHWQLDRSRAELGRKRLDLVLLHNPERSGVDEGLERRLRSAFTSLEAAVHAGHITGYGIATWTLFSSGRLSVEDLELLAVQAAGHREHHLRAVQLPVSLVEIGPLAQALNGVGPIPAARARGWETFASAPLHGGDLPHLATDELAALLRPSLTRAQACLAAVASCPGLENVFLSASSASHWTEAVAALADDPVDPALLRKAVDVLASV